MHGGDSEISNEEAHAILEPYFIVARRLFTEYCEGIGLGDAVKSTKFECRPEIHDSERHYAATTLDGRKVLVAPELAELPEDTVAAIFAHEFGHVLDHLYPACFVCVEDELVFLGEVPEGEHSDQTRLARMKQWEGRDDHIVEVTADQIAEQVTGSRIGYSGPCMLQGLNRGVRRPKHVT
jgi:hypothetical protein